MYVDTYYLCAHQYVHSYVLKMQQYISISPYRDTLGSDTVLIATYLSHINILNIMIY